MIQNGTMQKKASGGRVQEGSPTQIGQVMRSRKYFFEKDKLTPTAESKWGARLKRWLNTFDCPKLEKRIRKELGYSQDKFENATGIRLSIRNTGERLLQIDEKLAQVREMLRLETLRPDEIASYKEQEGVLKVELAFCLLKLCYRKAERKSEDPATGKMHLMRSHVLRAGLFAATMGPVAGWDKYDNAVGDLVHDLEEDVRDNRDKEVFFAVPTRADGGRILTVDVKDAALRYKTLARLFAYRVSKNTRAMTRAPEKKYKAENWEPDYQRYLSRLQSLPHAQRCKARDLINNGMELDTIVDKGEKKGVIKRTVMKICWSVPFERKVSRLTTEMMLAIVERYAEDPGLAASLRSITEKDVQMFEAGAVLVGKRSFSRKLLESCPDQGVPVIMLYHSGKGAFLLEIPHLDSEKARDVSRAKNIAKKFFGSKVEITEEQTMGNQRMRKTVFLTCNGSKADVEKNMARAVKLYDYYLKKTIPEAMGEGRQAWADRVRRGRFYAGPTPQETPETPLPGSEGARGESGLPGSDRPHGFRMHHQVADMPSSHPHGRFRPRRPL